MMKKLIIASSIVMSMVTTSAIASDNLQSQIQFLGTINEKTCDIIVDSDNGGSAGSVIQLGSVNKGTEGEIKNIVFKPATAGSCDEAGISTASVTWMSGALDNKGITNTSGQGATNAYVELKAKKSGSNTVDVTDPIVSGKDTATFTIADMDDGLAFTAQLKGTDVAGLFQSTAAYAITYN